MNARTWEIVDIRPVSPSDGWRVVEVVVVTELDDSTTIEQATYPLAGWAILRLAEGERYIDATDVVACWYDPEDRTLVTSHDVARDAGRVIEILPPGAVPNVERLKKDLLAGIARLEERRAKR